MFKHFRSIAWTLPFLAAPVLADEDFCAPIPDAQLRFEYRPSGPNRAVLRIHIPLRYEKASFQDLTAVLGDDRGYGVRLATERDEHEMLAVIFVPSGQETVSIDAVYHEKTCVRLLQATFHHGVRVVADAR